MVSFKSTANLWKHKDAKLDALSWISMVDQLQQFFVAVFYFEG